MSTIVFCHAHPDDEASQTSGTMARAAAEGHRVVVVFCTGGELGEVAHDAGDDETVAAYRRREAAASAEVLGLARVEWLGYHDSGMLGWEQNDADGSFHRADVDEAAAQLAKVFDAEAADVVIGYDWHGGYGHPDHVKVHHVVRRAVELAGRSGSRPHHLESTMNRSEMIRFYEAGKAAGEHVGDWDPARTMEDGNPFGSTEAEITWRVDVSRYLDQKRASLEAHRSQATDIEEFLAMPAEVFAMVFGYEHFIDPVDPGPMREGWPF
jgi:LmbE family N-acetylglucosaminyl deacetylase